MGASGNLMLLKEGDGQATEVFTTVAGLRGTSYAINGEPVDITDKDSGGFRQLLGDDTSGGGLKTLTITADGTSLGANTQQNNLRERAGNGSIHNYQLTDGTNTIEGAFQVVSYNGDGPLNQGQTFSVTLESADQWTVTP